MKYFWILYKYFLHILRAKNTKGHGVHSPFLYAFTQEVIYETNPFYIFLSIEKIRAELWLDNRILNVSDFGTGAKNQVKVSDLAKKSLKNKKWAQLLFRVINFSKAKNILELGTSLGVTTSYIASVGSDMKCVTLEGASEIVNVAKENFKKLRLTHVEVIEGNIDETLSSALEKFKTLDVVFFDANHRKEPTLRYFNQCLPLIHENTIFVFDDIYWSKEMCEAWQKIKENEQITATIDLFHVGIVFFNKSLPKINYKMNR